MGEGAAANPEPPGNGPGPAAAGDSPGIIARTLDEWLAGFVPPANPPFSLGATFPDAEWNHFFRVFSISTLIATAVVSANEYAATRTATITALSGPSTQALKALAIFTFFAVFYSVYARLFRVSINVRQALFCFSLILVPWFPLWVVLKAFGQLMGASFFLAFYFMVFYVVYLLASALSKVSGAAMWKVLLSFSIPVVLALLAFLFS